MNKLNLHLRYKKETGRDREDPDIMELTPKERIYVEWLEEIVESVIEIDPNLVDTLRNKPRKIIIKE